MERSAQTPVFLSSGTPSWPAIALRPRILRSTADVSPVLIHRSTFPPTTHPASLQEPITIPGKPLDVRTSQASIAPASIDSDNPFKVNRSTSSLASSSSTDSNRPDEDVDAAELAKVEGENLPWKLLRGLRGHRGEVTKCYFLADGRLVSGERAAASMAVLNPNLVPASLFYWTIKTGAKNPHPDSVLGMIDLCVSPNGRIIALLDERAGDTRRLNVFSEKQTHLSVPTFAIRVQRFSSRWITNLLQWWEAKGIFKDGYWIQKAKSLVLPPPHVL